MKVRARTLLLVALLSAASSCSVEKYLREGEYALVSNTVKVDDPEIKATELTPYIKQQSGNPTLFPKERDVVIYNPTLRLESEENLKAHLEYLGYFDSKVTSEVTYKAHRKAKVVYEIVPGRRITIKEINVSVPVGGTFPIDFNADSANVTVRPGNFLSEAALEEETERAASRMRDKGYYGFTKNHFVCLADTSGLKDEAILDITVRNYTRNENEANAREQIKYHIGQVTVSKDKALPFRDKVLTGLNTVRPGSLYRESDVTTTYGRFSSLKVFSSVGIEITPVCDSIVDCHINLNGAKIQGVKFDIEASSNSSGLIGISPKVNYYNKNIFHGGEWLNLGFMGNFQFMFNGSSRSNEFGVNAGLSLPRFLGIPYSHFKGADIPRTDIDASYNYQDRPEYKRNILSLSYGYKGIRGNKLSYQIYPLKASFVRLYNIDAGFMENLESNPFMKYAYQDHLDAGAGGTLYWASTIDTNPKVSYRYLRISLDLSGNVLSIFRNAMASNGNSERLIFGVPFAQYVKGEIQLGKTWRLGRYDRHAIAARILGGIGCAYGNSSAIPFEKQFYSGGANSMRGWQARSLGPGSSPLNTAFSIPGQTGDIKLEANVEYRFPLFWKLEGATFADVGNIWTLDRDGADMRGVFRFRDFYRTIGADWGIGLRCDLNFIVIRIDYGMQLYDPVEGQGWVNPGDWFRSKSAVHFGVGYPF